MRWFYGLLALALVLGLALAGCAFKYPSCGPARVRADGAMCAECVDTEGSFSRCSADTAP